MRFKNGHKAVAIAFYPVKITRDHEHPTWRNPNVAKAKKTVPKTAAKKAPAKKVNAKVIAKKAAPKAAAKTSAKPSVKSAPKAAKTPVKKAAKSTRKPNAAFMKALTLSPELAAVIGKTTAPRTEVVKGLWAYIKKNNLQDSKNRRNINADDKLKVIFGGKATVDMFQMTGLVSKHLK
jgi:upstream activation factor subunit UAF30